MLFKPLHQATADRAAKTTPLSLGARTALVCDTPPRRLYSSNICSKAHSMETAPYMLITSFHRHDKLMNS